MLALLSVVASADLADLATRHLALTLAFVWGIFVYRDIWPLATFNLMPVDDMEGGLLWAKLGVLTVAAVAVPLLVPRKYVPVDPKVSVVTTILCMLSDFPYRIPGSLSRSRQLLFCL